ncbi:type II toxin-antitoxin system VapC family toxin [Candidatus Woesearchaeota archaeon]|nr:type II toxin-antitoxin system VapC family toxin [Candidatus Woesearchaeota archaeon]
MVNSVAVLLDTSFIIALALEEDSDHLYAVALNNQLKTGRFGATFYTDYIINEVLTLLRRKKVNKENIKQLADILFMKKRQLLLSNDDIVQNAITIFFQYKRLSFVDASSIAYARMYKISKIYSFDTDFDGVEGIERIH